MTTTLPSSLRVSTATGATTAFASALADPGRFSVRAIDRLRMGHDASHYAMTPLAVATPVDADEVGRLFARSATSGVPLTFRSGGTSLSGQASTSGLLVDTRKHFRSVEILDDGMRVRIGPGATVRSVNVRLAAYGRKLGPDPASEIACTLGGVVANNSSGMACGTTANTYQTLDSHRARPAERHGRRHRPPRRRRPAARTRARRCTRGWPACATGCGATRRRCAPSSGCSP